MKNFWTNHKEDIRTITGAVALLLQATILYFVIIKGNQ